MNCLPAPPLLFQIILQPVPGVPALLREVTAHPACIQAVVLHLRPAVRQNHRDSGFLRLLQNGFPACLHDRVEHDIIHLLQDQIADCLHLVLLLLLSVLEDQIVAVFLREHILKGLCVGGSPVGFRADLHISDHNIAVLLHRLLRIQLSRSLSLLHTPTAGCKEQLAGKQRRRDSFFSHSPLLKYVHIPPAFSPAGCTSCPGCFFNTARYFPIEEPKGCRMKRTAPGQPCFYLLFSLIFAKILCNTMKKQSSAATAMLDHELSSLPFVFTSVEIVPLISTPKKEPMTFPTPPVNNVPPITEEAMASISSPSACCTFPDIAFRQ